MSEIGGRCFEVAQRFGNISRCGRCRGRDPGFGWVRGRDWIRRGNL